jgi:electron transport complex protein RnfB
MTPVDAILTMLFSLAAVSGLGVLFGLLLSVASRYLHVERDQRLESVEQALPQLNCGACGFAGCASYAAALVGGEAALDLCTPGGEKTAAALAAILGVEASYNPDRRVTQVHCRGGRGTAVYAFTYSGLKDCTALSLLGGGDKVCTYSCLGQGSCMRVCPVDCIEYDEQGLVRVDKERCIACGRCIDVCPTKVMRFIPKSADMIVACNSTDSGPVTKRSCTVGCTGCKICEKRSPEGGFLVTESLSKINYTMKGERRQAALKCPPRCIIPN